MSHSEKIRPTRVIESNAKRFEGWAGAKPLFSLTPDGATALKCFLKEKEVIFKRVGGEDEFGVDTSVLLHFLKDVAKIDISLDGAHVARLFGATTPSFNLHGCDMVMLDRDALEELEKGSKQSPGSPPP